MALIAMAVHDTEENKRTELTQQTLHCLASTAYKHRVFIVDNNSCEKTKKLIQSFACTFKSQNIITLPENIGTARAINRVIKLRNPNEHVIKIDNDVVINSNGWIEEMEETLRRMPSIGILGLKRKDIIQTTWHPDPEFRTRLIMIPHAPGERWITFEESSDVIGTCTMFNHTLLDKLGYSFQPGLYGYEDTLFCRRAHIAGFTTGFINHIDIDHIDPGGTEYIGWKQKHSGEHTEEMIKIFKEYLSGARSVYQEFY